MKKDELELQHERIYRILKKATDIDIIGKDWRSNLLEGGLLSVLISDACDGGRKSIFNAKISEINAFEIDEVGGKKGLNVEIIMASSSQTGSRQLVKISFSEFNNSIIITCNPSFENSVKHVMDVRIIFMRHTPKV